MLHAYSDKRHDGGEEGRKGPDKVEKIEVTACKGERTKENVCVCMCECACGFKYRRGCCWYTVMMVYAVFLIYQ